MSDTDRLIDALVADARPVRRLGAPWLRWCAWSGIALVAALVIFVAHGLREDLLECFTEVAFLTSTVAALVTAFLAVAGVMVASLPDRSSRWLLLPLPAAIVWIGGTTGGCLLDWVVTDFSQVRLAAVLDCLGILAVVSLPLSIAQFVFLRPFARIAPRGTIAVGSLATGAMSAAVLNLAHGFDTSAMLLIWGIGAGGLIFVLDWLAVRGMFRWLRPASSFQAPA